MSARKLRMLIVGAFPTREIREHGGILTSCRVLLGSSLPQRMDLILIDSSSPTVPPPPYFRRLLRAGVRVIVTAWKIISLRPDAVLLFASIGSSFIEKSIVAAIARLFGCKTMMFPRGAGLVTQYESSRVHRAVLGMCFRIPTLMLCQGSAYRDFFVNRVRLPPQRCPVLHNWTATSELLGIGASRRYEPADSPLEILFLGWVDREKGVFELLDCARRLCDARDLPSFRVVIAGDGAAMAEVRQYLTQWGLNGVVELLGWIDAAVRSDRLRRAHVLVLPSYMEGMPNAVIEAMASALPVVATDVGAVADIVSDGVNGFLIPPRDVDRLFAPLHRLLQDEGLRRRMGEAGWRIANERFSTEIVVEQLIELSGTGR